MQTEQKRELKAIHTSDLTDILQKLDVIMDFKNGKISCNVCGDLITFENIGSLKKIIDKVIFTCNKPSCYNEVVKTMKG